MSAVSMDLVLEGGGAKGLALAGAVAALSEGGVGFQRCAGTSAGALVAALVAAGTPPAELDELARELDLSPLVPATGPLDVLGALPRGGDAIFHVALRETEPLRAWLAERLAERGVVTFGDLRRDDPGGDLPPGRSYELVVTAADVTRGRQVRLPWDYADYGLHPDLQPVADAVIASAAIPLVFEPVRLEIPDGEPAVLVDGGLLSNFPVDIFDRSDGRPPRWPTLGIKLSARPEGTAEVIHPVDGPVSYLRAVATTAVTGWDQRHLEDPEVLSRTVFVDTSGVDPLDFDLDARARAALVDAGRDAAARWLERR